MTPTPGPELLSAAGFTMDEGPETFDPMRDGLRLMEAQRRMRVSLAPGQPEVHFIGGFMQVATVARHGIAQRVVRPWPEDRIGAPIAPRAAAPLSPQERLLCRMDAGRAA